LRLLASSRYRRAAARYSSAPGTQNIGADDHHTKVVLAIIEQLRERERCSVSRTELRSGGGVVVDAAPRAFLCGSLSGLM
jgi:hypothetical protein